MVKKRSDLTTGISSLIARNTGLPGFNPFFFIAF
jgi:hypothetical protein